MAAILLLMKSQKNTKDQWRLYMAFQSSCQCGIKLQCRLLLALTEFRTRYSQVPEYLKLCEMICLALVSKSRIDSARLYYLILVILPIACVLAIEFEALSFPDGSPICGAGPPIIDGVFRTVSVIGCAIQCGLRNNASSVQCNFFNYFKQSKRCELFFDSPVLNPRPDLDCVSYKVKV